MTGGGQDPIEDLGLAADVELGGGLVEQHQTRTELHRAQRACQRDALPLSARQVGAAVVALRQDRVEGREVRSAGPAQRRQHRVVGRASRRHVVAQRQFELDEVLEDGGDP